MCTKKIWCAPGLKQTDEIQDYVVDNTVCDSDYDSLVILDSRTISCTLPHQKPYVSGHRILAKCISICD